MIGQQRFVPGTFVYPSFYDTDAISYYQYVLANDGVFDVSLSELNTQIVALKQILPRDQIAAAMDLKYLGYQFGTGVATTLGRGLKRWFYFGETFGFSEQTNFTQQALVLRWINLDGNFLFTPPNTAGNGVKTAHTTVNDITGDIDISAKIDITYLPTGSGDFFNIVDKRSGNWQYGFNVLGQSRSPRFIFNATGYFSTAVLPTNYNGYVRCTRDAGSGILQFFTSDDGLTWTQLGLDVATPTGNLTSINTPLSIGATATTLVTEGGTKIYNALVYDGIRENGGTIAANFDAAVYDISVSQNTLIDSSTGATWTINRSSSLTGYKGQIVYKTTAQWDGLDDTLVENTFTQAQPTTCYGVFDQMTWSSGDTILNGGSAVLYTQSIGTPNISANAGTVLNFVGEALNSLKHYMIQLNDTNSITGINGVYQAGAAAGNSSINRLDIGSGAAANYSNSIINTVIISKQADTLATRNSMNELVRSWNSNPV